MLIKLRKGLKAFPFFAKSFRRKLTVETLKDEFRVFKLAVARATSGSDKASLIETLY